MDLIFCNVIMAIFTSVARSNSQDPLMGLQGEGRADSPSMGMNQSNTTSATLTTARDDDFNSTKNISNVSISSILTENSNLIVTTSANDLNSSDDKSRVGVTSAAAGEGSASEDAPRFTEAGPEVDNVTGLVIISNLTQFTDVSNISTQNQVTNTGFENNSMADTNITITENVMVNDNSTLNVTETITENTVYINDTICQSACFRTDLTTTLTPDNGTLNFSTYPMYHLLNTTTLPPSFYSETTVRYLMDMTTTTTTVDNSNSTANYTNMTNPETQSPYQNVRDPELCKICKSRIQQRNEPAVIPEKALFNLRMTKRVWRVCPPILFFFGTVGNILSGAVMMRRSLRTSITSFFLVTLAVVDTFMLWNGLLRHYLLQFHDIDVRAYGTTACRLHIFLTYWGGQFSAWILVCMTMERFFAIFSPHKSKQYVSKFSCAVVVGVIGILLAGLNAHFFKVQYLYYHQGRDRHSCTTRAEYSHFMSKIWTWIDFAFFSFIPFGILTLGNIGIILRIAHSNYVRKHSMKQNTGGVKMTSMTAILLTVSLVFFLTTAPTSIFLVIQEKVNQALTWETYALKQLWWAIVVNVNYINHSCNFFLYCISGPRFRRELRAIFALHQRVHPVTVTQTMENSVKTTGIALPTRASSNV